MQKVILDWYSLFVTIINFPCKDSNRIKLCFMMLCILIYWDTEFLISNEGPSFNRFDKYSKS